MALLPLSFVKSNVIAPISSARRRIALNLPALRACRWPLRALGWPGGLQRTLPDMLQDGERGGEVHIFRA